ENVRQVHLQRIGALAQLERGHRRRWRNQNIYLFESAREILADQLSHLLRAQVVGVVITGAQNVSAENNSAFHFRAETFCASAAIEIENISRIFRAISVTHTVEPRKVRRCL